MSPPRNISATCFSRSWATLCIQVLLVLVSFMLVSPAFSQGMPAVVSLAKEQEWDRLETLLNDGINANAAYGDGTTALHWATYHDNPTAVRSLLAADANVNAITDLGVSALWLAAENGSLTITEQLLQAGADPDARLLSGETLVMTAAQSGNGAVVSALLKAGADPDAAVTREQTALMWAANRGHADAVAALVEYGADVHARSLVRRQYVKSEKEQDSNDVYKHWVQQGGNTALMFAARGGDVQSARTLLEAGARVNDVNAFGTSPLIMAVHSGNLALLELLLDSGANINGNDSGHTALHAAILRGNYYAVQLLLDRDADLESVVLKATPVRRQATDYNFHDALIGATPLWLAARFAEPEIMQALIDGGADPFFLHDMKYPGQRMGENFMVEEGKISILMAAVGMGHRRLRLSWWTPERRAGQLPRSREEFMLDAVSVALRAGVDPALANSDGETALTFAKARRYDAVAGLLESIGSAQ